MNRPSVLDPVLDSYYLHSEIDISKSALWSCAAGGALLIAYLLHALCVALDYPFLSIFEILWNAFVWLMPSSLVLGLRPSLCGTQTSSHDLSGSSEHAAKSEVLRNVFKLERLRSFSLPGGTGRTDGPPGLGNWDNSCYQNSVLQALASVRCLVAFFDQLRQNITDLPNDTTIATLEVLLETLNDKSHNGRLLWTPHRLKSMSSWQQQDAQEYYSRLVDDMEKETIAGWKRNRPGVDQNKVASLAILPSGKDKLVGSLSTDEQLSEQQTLQQLRSPLEGLVAQRVGCTRCGYTEGLSLLPFNCLTLPLSRGWSYDVRQCLDDFTALEYIEGVECPKCSLLASKYDLQRQAENVASLIECREADVPQEFKDYKEQVAERLTAVEAALEEEDFAETTLKDKCNIPSSYRMTSTKSKQVMVVKPPECLVLHVNRSLFDEYTGAQLKNYADVEYRDILDLSKWCMGNSATATESDPLAHPEAWEMNPTESMRQATSGAHSTAKCRYKLRAVITHLGRHENGHYVCYRRLPQPDASDIDETKDKSEVWWRLSDEKVARVDDGEALSQGGAFMLFYERTADDNDNDDDDDDDYVEPVLPLVETPRREVTVDELYREWSEEPSEDTQADLEADAESQTAQSTAPLEKPESMQFERKSEDSDRSDSKSSGEDSDSGSTLADRSYSPLPSAMRTAGLQHQHSSDREREPFTASRQMVATT